MQPFSVGQTVHPSGNPCKTHQIKPHGTNDKRGRLLPVTRPFRPLWPLCCCPCPRRPSPLSPTHPTCIRPAAQLPPMPVSYLSNMSRCPTAAALSAAASLACGPHPMVWISGLSICLAVAGPMSLPVASPSAASWTVGASARVSLSGCSNEPHFFPGFFGPRFK